jgi:predicted transcriptional regulator
LGVPRKHLDDLGTLQAAVMEAVWALGAATVHQVRRHIAGDEGAGNNEARPISQDR